MSSKRHSKCLKQIQTTNNKQSTILTINFDNNKILEKDNSNSNNNNKEEKLRATTDLIVIAFKDTRRI